MIISELLYDYYPTLSAAKEAVKRIKRTGYHAVIRNIFMSDTKAVYIKDKENTEE